MLARFSIIYTIAVTNVQSLLGAEPPNCMLNEPRKPRRKGRVEPSSIEEVRNTLDYIGAAAWPIARDAVAVRPPPPPENASAMKEIVHERVDHDHGSANLHPPRVAGDHHQIGQGHGQDFVGDAVDVPQGLYEGVPHAGLPVRTVARVSQVQLVLDPADDVAFRQITNEQEQRVGGLVEPAIAQIVRR
jgi:hypothetical protein